MKNKIPLRHLVFLGLCVALSLVTKRIISPITNILTDFIRIPGGGAATAFSLMFLLVGTSGLRWKWAATAASFAQCVIALSLGMSSYQGFLAVFTYTVPGVVMDLFRRYCPEKDQTYFALSCGTANAAGALMSNLLVFRLKGMVFLLWMLVAAVMGLLGGLLGEMIFRRILRIPEYKEMISCQKN